MKEHRAPLCLCLCVFGSGGKVELGHLSKLWFLITNVACCRACCSWQPIHSVWIDATSEPTFSPQLHTKKWLGPVSLDLGGDTNTPLVAIGHIFYLIVNFTRARDALVQVFVTLNSLLSLFPWLMQTYT